jgi:hypothetical protein
MTLRRPPGRAAEASMVRSPAGPCPKCGSKDTASDYPTWWYCYSCRYLYVPTEAIRVASRERGVRHDDWSASSDGKSGGSSI